MSMQPNPPGQRVDVLSARDWAWYSHPMSLTLTAILYLPVLYISSLLQGDGYRPVSGIREARIQIEKMWAMSALIILLLVMSILLLRHATITQIMSVLFLCLCCYALFHYTCLRPRIVRGRRHGTISYFDPKGDCIALPTNMGLASPHFCVEFFRAFADQRILVVKRIGGNTEECVFCNYTEDFIPVEVVDCSPTSISLRLLCARAMGRAAGVDLTRAEPRTLLIEFPSDAVLPPGQSAEQSKCPEAPASFPPQIRLRR